MSIPKGIVARAVLTLESGDRLYIEIQDDPDFYKFFSFSTVKKGSRKKKPVLAARPQGWAGSIKRAARKTAEGWWPHGEKVVSVKVRVYRRRRYLELLGAPPDHLRGSLSRLPNRSIPHHPWRTPAPRLPLEYTPLQKRMDQINPRR